MGQQRAAEIQLARDFRAEVPFELLGQDFAQHQLLSEILRPHHDRPRAGRAAARDEAGNQTGDNFVSSLPNPGPETRATTAAGIAPAKICAVSTVEIPRKMKTPSPPPPMAAAIVAVPMVATVATLTPASMVRMAKGSSTSQRTCRPVMPMATADSRTAGSTPRIPTSVLRSTGSTA